MGRPFFVPEYYSTFPKVCQDFQNGQISRMTRRSAANSCAILHVFVRFAGKLRSRKRRHLPDVLGYHSREHGCIFSVVDLAFHNTRPREKQPQLIPKGFSGGVQRSPEIRDQKRPFPNCLRDQAFAIFLKPIGKSAAKEYSHGSFSAFPCRRFEKRPRRRKQLPPPNGRTRDENVKIGKIRRLLCKVAQNDVFAIKFACQSFGTLARHSVRARIGDQNFCHRSRFLLPLCVFLSHALQIAGNHDFKKSLLPARSPPFAQRRSERIPLLLYILSGCL